MLIILTFVKLYKIEVSLSLEKKLSSNQVLVFFFNLQGDSQNLLVSVTCEIFGIDFLHVLGSLWQFDVL